jgi:hypothetical protein
MSAYSLFFRDTQSSIKSQNPQATFGDVSRIVASMWDSLDPSNKEVNSSLLHFSLTVLLVEYNHRIGFRYSCICDGSPLSR